jgi:hypothetical protein
MMNMNIVKEYADELNAKVSDLQKQCEKTQKEYAAAKAEADAYNEWIKSCPMRQAKAKKVRASKLAKQPVKRQMPDHTARRAIIAKLLANAAKPLSKTEILDALKATGQADFGPTNMYNVMSDIERHVPDVEVMMIKVGKQMVKHWRFQAPPVDASSSVSVVPIHPRTNPPTDGELALEALRNAAGKVLGA